MDVGTAFGGLGARREMMIGFLAEPALLMVLFTASLISSSTSLATIVETLAHSEFVIYPSLAFAGVAFTMVSLAENARMPVDNPATHLELTMVHEAMMLEYSGRHLALIEWAASLKLFVYSCIGLALFLPFGIAGGGDWLGIVLALPALLAKLAVGGAALALIETMSAKMRIFRAPEFLGTAFLLAVLAHAGPRPARGLRRCCSTTARQLINLLAAMLLLIAFAMLSQRRILSLINLFASQGVVLAASTALVAALTGQSHLYWSALSRSPLKVIVLPWILHRLIRRLNVKWDVETLINIPTTMLIGIVLVILAFNLAAPISQLAGTVTARDARHRAGERAALLPDDDHALEGGAAGDRLPGDGERPVLRRHQRDLRHADGGRARRRARRAGGGADPRHLLLPDPRALRQPRHAAPGEAEGGLMPARNRCSLLGSRRSPAARCSRCSATGAGRPS